MFQMPVANGTKKQNGDGNLNFITKNVFFKEVYKCSLT